MRERPILFSAPMVRAILAGTKTQTRRLVGLDTLKRSDTPGYDWTWRGQAPIRSIAQQRRRPGGCWQDATDDGFRALCPYGVPGDRLWVRETFYCDDFSYPDGPRTELLEAMDYRADHDCHTYEAGCPCSDEDGRSSWRPSIHMPRWASRITLEIASVRVERLQAITEDDARAEGVNGPHLGRWTDREGALVPPASEPARQWAHSFAVAWQAIHGTGSWFENPWVWALTFRRVEEPPCAP